MLTRRTLLGGILATSALSPIGLPWRAARAARAVGDDWKASFGKALASDPRLLGWHGLTVAQLETPSLRIEGKLPPDLVGTFYRNGPARHERGGRRYRHWFDGDGMVQAFRFDGEGISHRGRMVETEKFIAEEKAGRFLLPAFGTVADGDVSLSGPDDVNSANINVLYHAGELLALWEGGSAHRLDPRSLETLGRKVWRPDLAGVSFSAHPKVEPDGTLWNFGCALRQGLLLLYRIDPTGKLGAVDAIKLDHLGMVHDFVVTQRHLVFVLAPFIFDAARFGPETPFLDAHVWRPELGTRVLTVDKDDFKRQRWYQLPPGFHFHFGNAWEDAGGTIRFDYCVGPDPTVMTETLRYVMRGEWRPPTGPSRFGRVTLHASSGRVEQEISDLSSEFPRVAPAVVARRYRYVYLLAGDGGYAAGPLNVVVRWDLDSGANERFAYGTDMLAEEHVFVPRPGSDREDDGWLVGTVLDLREKITRISVFDARRLSDGPVASGTLPYALPLGFHGTFVPA